MDNKNMFLVCWVDNTSSKWGCFEKEEMYRLINELSHKEGVDINNVVIVPCNIWDDSNKINPNTFMNSCIA